MMKMEVTGVEDINRILSDIAPRQALNIMRSTVHGVAGEIRDDAKGYMSVDSGDMKKATKAKRERVRFGEVSSTVRVAKKAFYWRFREYGQGPDGEADAMFMKSVANFRAVMDQYFVRQFGKKFEAALARARKRG
jgi:hypothetical protein